MQIIEIIFMTTKKAKVLFDGGPSLVLYAGELKKLGWQEGDGIPREEYQRVRTQIVERRAKLYAMRLLQDQDRTEKELTDKLTRAGYDPAIAAAALAYVKGFGYVDDARYAEHYVEQGRGTKSRRQIREELIRRGISKDTVTAVMEDRTEEADEYEGIVRLLRKRRYDPPLTSDRKERDRQLRYLASKGFSYSAVRHVLEHWDEFE